jgi:hypothetical protein
LSKGAAPPDGPKVETVTYRMHTRHAYTYQQIELISAICDMAREFPALHPAPPTPLPEGSESHFPIVEVATQGGEEAAERTRTMTCHTTGHVRS